jgi:hypothetical protein
MAYILLKRPGIQQCTPIYVPARHLANDSLAWILSTRIVTGITDKDAPVMRGILVMPSKKGV